MASSVVGSIRTMYEWKIQNYPSHSSLANGLYLRSPDFDIKNTAWYLRMYPNGHDKNTENFVTLSIHPTNRRSASITVGYAFYIIDSTKKCISAYANKQPRTFNIGKMTPPLMKSSLLREAQCKNIIIICEISVEKITIDETLLTCGFAQAHNSKLLEGYLNNAQFSDVKLVVEKNEIYAHKMVLAANSKVFAAMFSHEMRENKDCIVVIDDIKYEVFCELLHFMYTGETGLSDDIACELLKASDKYELLNLKRICEIKMGKNLSTNNVIECLGLADTYNAESLRKESIDFIVSHGKDMIDQPEFDSLRTLHADLFKDVFRSIFSQPNKKRKSS